MGRSKKRREEGYLEDKLLLICKREKHIGKRDLPAPRERGKCCRISDGGRGKGGGRTFLGTGWFVSRKKVAVSQVTTTCSIRRNKGQIEGVLNIEKRSCPGKGRDFDGECSVVKKIGGACRNQLDRGWGAEKTRTDSMPSLTRKKGSSKPPCVSKTSFDGGNYI